MCFDCRLLSCDLQLQEAILTKDKWGNSMLRIAMAVEDRKAGAVELVLTFAQVTLTDIQVKVAAWFRVFNYVRCSPQLSLPFLLCFVGF